MSRLIRALAALAAACMLAGCQVTAPPVATPSPTGPATPSGASSPTTPTYMCTPEAGGPESECTQAQYDEMKAKDALYAEAEAVFREYFAENIRISRAGGVEEPTEVIIATTMGPARESVMQAFRDLAEGRSRARGDDPVLTITRVPGIAKNGSIVTMVACVDASGWSFYRGDKMVSEGRPAEDRIFFNKTTNGGLKMAFIEGRWVKSCAE